MESTQMLREKMGDAIDGTTRSFLDRVKPLVGGMQKRLQRERPVESSPKTLREWAVQAADAADNPSLKIWLDKMPAKEVKNLEKAAAEFAAMLHFQVQWVFESEPATKDLPLKETLSRSLLTFVEAYSLAQAAQPASAVLTAWMSWSKNPGKHQDLTRRLFAILFEQQRVTISRDFITMSEKERSASMVKSIYAAQQQDGAAFFAVFKQALENVSTGSPVNNSNAPDAPINPETSPESAAPSPDMDSDAPVDSSNASEAIRRAKKG